MSLIDCNIITIFINITTFLIITIDRLLYWKEMKWNASDEMKIINKPNKQKEQNQLFY